MIVESGHEEADDGLEEDANHETVLWTEQVGPKRTQERPRQVEDVEQGVPSVDLCERTALWQHGRRHGGAVDAESIGGKVVDEPDDADGAETDPITLDDEPVRNLGPPPARLLEGLWLGQLEPEVEERGRDHDPEADGQTPHRAEVVLGEDQDQDVWHKGAEDESHVDRNVRHAWGKVSRQVLGSISSVHTDKDGMPVALLGLGRGFGGSGRGDWVSG